MRRALTLILALLAVDAAAAALEEAAVDAAPPVIVGSEADRTGDEKYRIFQDLLRGWITQRTTAAASGGPASGHLDQWLELWEKVGHLSERADAVHLDRKQVVISLLLNAQAVVRHS